MLLYLAALAVVWAMATLYLAVRFREVRQFLAGAFFVSAGTLFYFYLANVSLPLIGTSFVFTPEVNGLRAIPHTIFFLLCLYFGFFWKPKTPQPSIGPRPAERRGF